MFQGLGCDPHVYDRKLTRDQFRPAAQLLSADDARSRIARAPAGCSGTRMSTCSRSCRRPRVEGCRCGTTAAASGCGCSAPPGSIIINTGDYMQRITNDRLPSTTHRVGKPSDGSHLAGARVSFPIAVYVWEDEILEVLPGLGPPKYEPIKAIAFHTRSTSKFYGDDYAVETALMRIAVVAPSCTLKREAADGRAGDRRRARRLRARDPSAMLPVRRPFRRARRRRGSPRCARSWPIRRSTRSGSRAAAMARTASPRRRSPTCPTPRAARLYMGYSDAGFLLAGLHKAGLEVAWGPMPQDVLRERRRGGDPPRARLAGAPRSRRARARSSRRRRWRST